MTVQRLITLAFMDVGAIASGETPSSDESNDALDLLNQMILSWSNEGNVVFTETLGTFTLTPGATSYTMGVGGTWNTAQRAQKIVAWKAASGAFTSGGAPLPFAQFDAAAQAAAVSFASVAGQVLTLLAPYFQAPTLLLSNASVPMFLGADSAWPLLNVRVFPAPALAGIAEITYWTPISSFATLGDTINLPPGFELALRLNLAVLLYPQYARQSGIDPALAANAQNAKAVIAALDSAASPAAPQQPPAQ